MNETTATNENRSCGEPTELSVDIYDRDRPSKVISANEGNLTTASDMIDNKIISESVETNGGDTFPSESVDILGFFDFCKQYSTYLIHSDLYYRIYFDLKMKRELSDLSVEDGIQLFNYPHYYFRGKLKPKALMKKKRKFKQENKIQEEPPNDSVGEELAVPTYRYVIPILCSGNVDLVW